jgi:regulatory protein
VKKRKRERRLDGDAALTYALSLLSYRARSEAEMRRRLSGRGYAPEAVEYVISELEELNYLDDNKFARSWVRSRRESRPGSRDKVMWELRAKGVGDEVIAEVLEDEYPPEDEVRVARMLAEKRASRQNCTRRSLYDYLRRRGFGYDVISQAVLHLDLEAS